MLNAKIVGIVIALVIGAIGGYLIPRSAPVSPVSQTESQPKMSETVMTQTPTMPPNTADEKITNAMSAAPEAIAKDATILDWPATDTDPLPSLRAGTNEWTCLPDFPVSPGNDPICVDKAAMQWFSAYLAHKTPKLSQAGLGYMLQGGSDPSNTDPYATEPKQGESWMSAPAHVMIFPSQKLDTKVYGTDSDSGRPWIMYAGTDYEHIMMPVK